MFRILCVIAFSISTLTACTTENIRPGSAITLDGESAALLIGFNPRYKVALLRGPVKDNIWTRPAVDFPEAYVYPEDGYILVKLKPTSNTEKVGISLITFEQGNFIPCNDSNNPVFELKSGTINYAGELNFNTLTNSYSLSLNEKNARNLIASKYPGGEQAIEVRPAQIMQTKSQACDPIRLVVPVYLPPI